jgi:hypothetical protein
MDPELLAWLLDSDEPWTRYRTLVDLLDRPEDDPSVQAARAEMLDHQLVRGLIAETATWGERALMRHSDASHPIYKFSILADFGVRAGDIPPGSGVAMDAGIEAVLAHQSPEGAFQTIVNIPRRFGGTGEDAWSWIACDAPTLLYSLLAFGLGNEPRVQRAVEHLLSLAQENGWRCVASPDLGTFRGPGRKTDPCPIVNVYALKALALVSEAADSPTTRAGAEMLLSHWQCQQERKIYLFGIGTDYRKLKYPLVWYNILHTVSVLSQFPFVLEDSRFQQMIDVITQQAGPDSRYTATSMYRHWKDWSFADKKHPSPWLTFLVHRVLKRISQQRANATGDHACS